MSFYSHFEICKSVSFFIRIILTTFVNMVVKKKRADKLETVWLKFQIESETNFLKNILLANNYNYKASAKFLGIERSHLYNLVKKYGITRPQLSGL